MEYEAVDDVPCGLISCRIGGVQAHILRISPRGARLRVSQRFDMSAPAQFRFYAADGSLNSVALLCEYVPTGEDIYTVSTDHPDFARHVRATLRLYAEYAACRMDDDWDGVESLLTTAPAAGKTADRIEDQYELWYRSLAPAQLDFSGKEIYVTLDCPALWHLFLADGDFRSAYAALRRIPPHALPERIHGVIIGSEYCACLFPDAQTLTALMQRAQTSGLRFAIATAEAVDPMLLASAAAYQRTTEVLINDWGMLNRVGECAALTPVLGTRLNRRRKDPRMAWRSGVGAFAELIPQNAANDPNFRKMLAEIGVQRYEYEACASPNAPVGTCNSLHLPLYHTNASRLCPLRAQIEFGNRSRQIAGGCAVYCEDNACLYPERYRMLGRGNTIIAFDADFAIEGARDCYDRIVFNF